VGINFIRIELFIGYLLITRINKIFQIVLCILGARGAMNQSSRVFESGGAIERIIVFSNVPQSNIYTADFSFIRRISASK
jgi:hypothetical protein